MFLNLDFDRHWDPGPSCRSCKELIRPGEATEEIRFQPHPGHRIEDLSGLYHAECARPYLSLARAFYLLGRLPF